MEASALPRTLDGWLQLLEQRHAQSIQLGLERVAAVRAALGPDPDAVVITVGGTNGKGSCCAMLEAILLAEGYRVGCYTSPHLLRYNERVRLDGKEASDEALVEAFQVVEAARGSTPLTYFEHGTLAAWSAFRKHGPDVIILEVGLGGRLDAVNVFDADCALVTSVALDHMDYLGDSRDAIGFEKAGIFRAGRPAVCGDPQPPATLLAHADSIGAQLWVSGRDFGFGGDRQQWGYWRYQAPPAQGVLAKRGGLAYPALRGANQLLNAAAVMTVLDALKSRIPVSMQAIRQGLMLVDVPGRFQVLPGRPAVVLDVAHNPQAAGVLAENLGSMGFYPETWAVFGMLGDKDAEGVVALMKARVDHWLLADLPGPRGLKAEELALRLRTAGVDTDIRCFPSPKHAYAAAQQEAGEGDRIVAFGSFLTVAEVLDAVKAARH
ncbi:bifunctional tetrahydrofolate synthase/dihydrofolate synthase [Thauera linaloolentis]|uniref:Dihydrofolate synthase/folylpolyglutamate synthase n=1 Tax=Thauera linaloolentis (strain DSM 12138 / JCM 21573 / CCUG 41526 / CIP 105981 / IAM 15112 / NBRC 102519 / 47Lol) TaxID=1123367 RepID=N6Y790_THAL4|nr:bifunctional tetrahydrofolate synthase/dihydrofolate synthase [Thauera linaloolentis]ENO90156.1 dihydrofolate synthase/tetrahydrofolylpolyglutamate synthase [Thauera linaloolentis 47Lol = DSM 12138]MCM8564707.1 bifunctional tetrahydrofolate synthase/dihydrofolate synthase [Thauera linaloolentis]